MSTNEGLCSRHILSIDHFGCYKRMQYKDTIKMKMIWYCVCHSIDFTEELWFCCIYYQPKYFIYSRVEKWIYLGVINRCTNYFSSLFYRIWFRKKKCNFLNKYNFRFKRCAKRECKPTHAYELIEVSE